MINSFDSDVAMDVGINAAIIYRNIQYWCEKNKTNEQNEYDGLFWTYNSISAFGKQFPYLSKRQIEKALNDLEENGYIRTGNFNKSSYDRTKWYADIRCKNVKCISPVGEMERSEMGNGFLTEGKPIPNNNTNQKTDIIKKERKNESSYDSILDADELVSVNSELREAIIGFLKMRKMIKKPITDDGLILAIKKAKKLSGNNPDVMVLIFQQSVMNSWQGVFPLKDDQVKKNDTRENEFDRMLKEEGYN